LFSFINKNEILLVFNVEQAASDIYAPVSGEVVEVNTSLKTDPAKVNKSPYGDGWMAKLKLNNVKELDALMDEAGYKKHVDSEKH
jgi:glycine cleavage system H protein